MAIPRKLLTTPILDTHGKIGPFFFKEFFMLFLIASCLFFSVLMVDLFITVPSHVLITIPGSLLLLVACMRTLVIKKIASPWYLHVWAANRFFWPKSIIANTFNAAKHEPS